MNHLTCSAANPLLQQLSILAIALLTFGQVSAQTTVSIADGSVATCGGTLFDTGGQGGTGYQNGEYFVLTICPDNPNDVITLDWLTFNLDQTNTATPPANNQDNLTIYDGDNILAPTLGTYTGSQLQGLLVSCTSLNTTGCLTLVWSSNNQGTGIFAASITCDTPCQRPTVDLVAPVGSPQKLCIGEDLTFDGSASFAAPGFNIAQWIWNFGDGNVDSNGTAIATHSFAAPGEYLVDLFVVDDNGCINNNRETVQVLVGTEPTFTGTTADTTLCLGESVCLDGVVNPTFYSGQPINSLGGATYLPDDVGQCFTATIDFAGFTPGQTLSNIGQLLGICVNMEHSFMGDLVATIYCPNGQNVIMHQQGGGGTYIGDPIDIDDPNLPGIGWDYCWDPLASNGTWVDNSGGTNLPPGSYESLNPLDGLVGCPLNGTWTLEFCDLWGADDGFVFGWNIDLDSSLFPPVTTFEPVYGAQCDSTSWAGGDPLADAIITSTSADCNQICITPTDYGTFEYIYSATDDFGCTYDTTITVTVSPGPTVDAGNDTTICGNGTQLQLNAVGTGGIAPPPGCDYVLNMYDTFGDGWNGFEVEILINGVSIGTFTFANGNFATANFTVQDGDLIQINTVSGTFDGEVSYEIVDAGGNIVWNDGTNPAIGTGVWNGVISCPNAQPPYNYNWTPTTGLSDPSIADPVATINGPITYVVEVWEPGHQLCSMTDTIVISVAPTPYAGTDNAVTVCPSDPAFDMFGFVGNNPDLGGVWEDANSVAVSNMFNPLTDPAGVYAYIVDNGACPADSSFITVNVLVGPYAGTDSTITVCANDLPFDMFTYVGNNPDVGGTWEDPNNTPMGNMFDPAINPAGAYTYIVNGGQCPADSSVVTINVGVNMNAGNDSTVTVCWDDPAFDLFGALGGTPDAGGVWEDANGNAINNMFDPAVDLQGTYTYIVDDGICPPDSAFVTVNILQQGDPACGCPLESTVAFTNPLCANSCDGTITVTDAFAQEFSIDNGATWQPSGTFNNLCGGTYTVLSRDIAWGAICVDTVTATLTDPVAMTLTFTATDVSCFGACDGTANAIVAGGTTPYAYTWNGLGGNNDTQVNGVCAGVHSLTVTDANGCSVDTLNFPITEPPQLLINNVTATDETCHNDCDGTLTVDATNALNYSIDGGATTQATNVFTNLCVGTYDVWVQDANGCVVNTNAVVSGPPPVVAEFTASPQPTTISNTEIFFTNLSQNALTYNWNIGGLGTSTDEHPSFVFPEEPANYEVCLVATNAFGCSDSICHQVIIDDELIVYAPNAFTPNGDGTNDYFQPLVNGHEESDFELLIYNRWGQLLFESSTSNLGWGGTYFGEPVQEDVYVWKLRAVATFDGEVREYIGHVTVIR